MSGRHIVGLGVRLFSIWLVLYVLTNVPGMWRFNVSADAESTNLVVIVVASLVLALAAALWLFPLSIANTLVPGRPTEPVGAELTQAPFERVERLAFCLLGLWVLAEVVPNGFYWLFMAYHASRPQSLLDFGPREYSMMAVTVSRLVIGVWLLFGARGLRGLLKWARTTGT